MLGIDLQTLATTGTKLKDWTAATWDTSTTMAECQGGNMVRELWGEASKADKIMCYMAAMETNNLITNFKDGADHIYSLDPSGGKGKAMSIKVNAALANGALSTFKLWTCESAGNKEYVSADFTGTPTLVSVSGHNDGSGNTGAQRTTVTGTLGAAAADGTPQWASKTATHYGSFGNTGFAQSQFATLTQLAGEFDVAGWMTGNAGGQTFTGQVYIAVQALNPASASTIALGTGSGQMNFTAPGGTTFANTFSWHGDDRSNDATTTGDFYAKAKAATLVTSTASAITTAIAFAGAEAWDCSGTATAIAFPTDATALAAVSTALGACDTKFGFSDHGGALGCGGH